MVRIFGSRLCWHKSQRAYLLLRHSREWHSALAFMPTGLPVAMSPILAVLSTSTQHSSGKCMEALAGYHPVAGAGCGGGAWEANRPGGNTAASSPPPLSPALFGPHTHSCGLRPDYPRPPQRGGRRLHGAGYCWTICSPDLIDSSQYMHNARSRNFSEKFDAVCYFLDEFAPNFR